MSSTSTPFDWDRAISLFKSTDQWYTDTQPLPEAAPAPEQPRCRKGLHALTPDNVSVNARTGHRRCRACIRQAKQARRERVQTQQPEEAYSPGSDEAPRSEQPRDIERVEVTDKEDTQKHVSVPVPQFTVSPQQLTITVTPPELTVTPPSLVMLDTALLALIPTDSVVSYLRSLGYTVIPRLNHRCGTQDD